jgi:hypothetical protein
MYRGFNLTISDRHNESFRDYLKFDSYYKKGLSLYEEQKTCVTKDIDKYIESNNALDGESIIADWFPKIEANVFISHSHKDEKLAISLAGLLNEEFGLTSFVDSCVWNYSDDLLKKLDDEYCVKSGSTYFYKKRNYSTSHVHMMLSTALSNMIYSCECLIFLNTPSSISKDDIDDSSKTESPWIFSEIVTSALVKENIPERITASYGMEELKESTSMAVDRRMNIKYKLDMSHLTKIKYSDLIEWKESCEKNNIRSEAALDELYTRFRRKHGN